MSHGLDSSDNQNRGKVLIVSFNFPPTNSVAAIRVGKFAKYLPSFGWDPIVLTVDKVKDFPQTLPIETAEVNVVRSPYFTPGPAIFHRLTGYEIADEQSWKSSRYTGLLYRILRSAQPLYALPLLRLVVLEPLGWYRPAVNTGLEIVSKNKVDVIFSSYGPAMSHIIASRLHRETGIPWVADFRDLWSLNHYLRKVQPFHFFEQKLEKRVMKGSDLLITVSEPMAEQLKTLHSKEVVAILNGFDDEDYQQDVPLTTKFTITYTGNIYTGKRDPTLLFKVIAELLEEGKISPGNFEARFFGGNTLASLLPVIKAHKLNDVVRIFGFVPFKESVKHQKESTALLQLMWVDNITEKGIYTGKLFEYLGAHRPILAIGPKDGVVDALLTETGTGLVVNKEREIKTILSKWIEEFQHSGAITSNYKPKNSRIRQYTRRQQAGKLAQIFNRIAKL